MLRLLVLLLLLANGAYFAWARGVLQPIGLAPAQQTEPQRLAQQIRPEALRVTAGEDARRLEAAPWPPECLAAGPIDDAIVAPLRQVLQSWPPGSWTLEPLTEPARWIVYMGKYPSAEAVDRKRAELRQIGVAFESLTNPELEPGLALGSFPTEAQAVQQLNRLAERGVRTARVVQERAELRAQRLVLPALDDGLRTRLDELRAPLAGRQLRACR
jgi:hypothetical protein